MLAGMAKGLTTKEVMAQLSVKDPDTIYALGKAGKIRGERLRRQWRWDADSINEFLRGAPPLPPPAPRPRPRVPELPAVPDRVGEYRRT